MHLRRAQHALPGLALHNGYGPTECTDVRDDLSGAAIRSRGGGQRAHRPADRRHARARAGRRRNEAPAGAPGELHRPAARLARGDPGRPDLDGRALHGRGRWRAPLPHRRPGPLARGSACWSSSVDPPPGEIRGYRIEPGEIEADLARQPGVRTSAVIADDGPAGRPLLAYVVGEASRLPRCARRWRAPLDCTGARRVHPVPALPLTAIGKSTAPCAAPPVQRVCGAPGHRTHAPRCSRQPRCARLRRRARAG